MEEDTLLIACFEEDANKIYSMHVWKGPQLQIAEEDLLNYIEKIKRKFFLESNFAQIKIIDEIPYEESDQLQDMTY
jgi:hypothetical protein